MASSRMLFKLQMAVVVLLTCYFISIYSLPIISAQNAIESRKLVLGSHPPRCINRCMNCRPCRAALSIPPPKISSKKQAEEENYYLVTWKCKCKNKLFQP